MKIPTSRQVHNYVKAVIRHALDDMRKVTPDEAQVRLSYCKGTDWHNNRDKCVHNNDGECMVCDCPIDDKVKWCSEECPKGK